MFSISENEHFGLVFVYTESKNSGTILSFWKRKLPHFGGENYPRRVVSLKIADQILSRPKKQADTDVTDLFMLVFTI